MRRPPPRSLPQLRLFFATDSNDEDKVVLRVGKADLIHSEKFPVTCKTPRKTAEGTIARVRRARPAHTASPHPAPPLAPQVSNLSSTWDNNVSTTLRAAVASALTRPRYDKVVADALNRYEADVSAAPAWVRSPRPRAR